MSIRIVLVDDHPVVRAGLRALIDGQSDLDVVGEAHDLASAEHLVALELPDVVLMDLTLASGVGGAEVTARLRARADAPEVLVLTTYDTEADVLRALDSGARGYLLKDARRRSCSRGSARPPVARPCSRRPSRRRWCGGPPPLVARTP
jgi:DNA-binding NarL/FixJ family response regulator